MQVFVKETPQGLRFPKNVPRKRSNTPKYAIIAVSSLVQIMGVFFSKENVLCYLINAYSTTFLAMGMVEITAKLCRLYEEYNHIQSRHNNSMKQLLGYVFALTASRSFVFVSSFFAQIILYLTIKKNSVQLLLDGTPAPIFVLFSTLLLNGEFNFETSPLNEALHIHKLNGLDYGSGMAHSFFHGYLRIALPHKGTEEKGLLEFLTDYEGRHSVKFDVYKLFILIPMSQYCPPSLDIACQSIEKSDELESKELDRAGVSKRNYKNSVYKIVTQGEEKKYVSVEYATPIKTLHEVMNQNTPSSKLYKEHSKELILNFYLTLKELIKEDPDCCNLCELIYYDDKNEDGTFRDVGGIILQRMIQIVNKDK